MRACVTSASARDPVPGSRLKTLEAPIGPVSRFDRSFAARIPGVGALAGFFGRIASLRWGRVPIGLVALLPVAVLIDVFDALDELAGGPLGMGASFLVEAAFLLGLTGRASYALAFAGLDLIPFVDVLPWATITLVRRIIAELTRVPDEQTAPPTGPIIDV